MLNKAIARIRVYTYPKNAKKNHSIDRVGRFLHPNGLFFSVYI